MAVAFFLGLQSAALPHNAASNGELVWRVDESLLFRETAPSGYYRLSVFFLLFTGAAQESFNLAGFAAYRIFHLALPCPCPDSSSMGVLSSGPRILAVLGPTNTGKTHLAIERMLGHQSGMIGFPLRLLARENYDRVVRLKGARAVALITGEEKIVPPNPSYFICTVESMPLDRPVDFLAIDEIQLCADPERGHVFTSRLLHARGIHETMFLGADTIRPLLRILVPEAEYVFPRAAPSSPSPPPTSSSSPSWCGASAAAPPWCSAP
jgi:hypothetical protein